MSLVRDVSKVGRELRENERTSVILNGTSNTIIILHVLLLVKYKRHITLLGTKEKRTKKKFASKQEKKNQMKRILHIIIIII